MLSIVKKIKSSYLAFVNSFTQVKITNYLFKHNTSVPNGMF